MTFSPPTELIVPVAVGLRSVPPIPFPFLEPSVAVGLRVCSGSTALCASAAAAEKTGALVEVATMLVRRDTFPSLRVEVLTVAD